MWFKFKQKSDGEALVVEHLPYIFETEFKPSYCKKEIKKKASSLT
jgi:hypothetical protein